MGDRTVHFQRIIGALTQEETVQLAQMLVNELTEAQQYDLVKFMISDCDVDAGELVELAESADAE